MEVKLPGMKHVESSLPNIASRQSFSSSAASFDDQSEMEYFAPIEFRPRKFSKRKLKPKVPPAADETQRF